MAEIGIGSKVRVVAAGNTLTLTGKLDARSHRRLLELLQGTPDSVRIVDHIEPAEEVVVSEAPAVVNEAPSAPPTEPIEPIAAPPEP